MRNTRTLKLVDNSWCPNHRFELTRVESTSTARQKRIRIACAAAPSPNDRAARIKLPLTHSRTGQSRGRSFCRRDAMHACVTRRTNDPLLACFLLACACEIASRGTTGLPLAAAARARTDVTLWRCVTRSSNVRPMTHTARPNDHVHRFMQCQLCRLCHQRSSLDRPKMPDRSERACVRRRPVPSGQVSQCATRSAKTRRHSASKRRLTDRAF